MAPAKGEPVSEKIELQRNRDAARYRILRDANAHKMDLFEQGESEFESFLKQGRALDEECDKIIETGEAVSESFARASAIHNGEWK